MKDITIRKVMPDDLGALQKIGRQTFFETFAAMNTEENMKKYLDERFSREQVSAELNDPNSTCYFAEREGKPIGYLKLNTGQSQTEIKDERALEIERIYVLDAYHGKKVGQLLLDQALQVARASNVDYVWLGVWEENVKAINFYHKHGFVAFDRHIFVLGDDKQTDIMMKLELTQH